MSQSDPVVDAEKTSHKASPRCWLALIVGVVVVALSFGIWSSCNEPGARCPDVTPPDEPFEVGFIVEGRIDWGVKDLLLDPESYERDGIYATTRPILTREDGSEYYGRYEVDFRASNTYGGMTAGLASVYVEESKEDGCRVVLAELH